MKNIIVPLVAAASIVSLTQAATVATWDDSSITYLDDEILAAGDTKVTIPDLTASSLVGVDVLILLEESNGVYGADITVNVSAIANFVNSGGFLVMYDRAIGNADPSTILPGSNVYTSVRDSGSDDLQFLPDAAGSGFYTGLDDTSYDGGSSSYHGYVTAATLGGAVPLISVQGQPDQVVEFIYAFGSGAVKYSGIPGDYYFTGSGDAGIQANLSTTVVNTLVAGPSIVPEPSSTLLLGLVACCGVIRRRR